MIFFSYVFCGIFYHHDLILFMIGLFNCCLVCCRQIFNNIKKVISSGTVNPPTSKTTPSYESHFPYPSPVYDMAHTPDNEEMDLTCREECFTEGDDADDIF